LFFVPAVFAILHARDKSTQPDSAAPGPTLGAAVPTH
jgi:hypothetical protein